MFFIEKNDVQDFQYRCVIALFLDFHREIRFEEYLKSNQFRGIINEQSEDIFLFNTPNKKNVKSGVIYRYIAKGEKEVSGFKYSKLNSNFIIEYRKFTNNSYEYIKQNFKEKNWVSKYTKLFVSNPPKTGDLYKYKSNPSKDKDSLKIFGDFLNGKLTFVNPMEMNDPFDCDCEIAKDKSLSILLHKAITKTKYGEFSANSKVTLTKIVQEIDKLNLECDDLKYLSDESIKMILSNIYVIVNPKIDDKAMDMILENYKSMINQLKDLKSEFRILCMAHDPKDILMWGYYGNSGKGICCKHSKTNIENAITKRGGNICIYGDITYPKENKKPKYTSKTTDMIDNVFEYIVKCTFTKFHRWDHESEFRYVLLGEEFGAEFITVDSEVDDYYLGCENEKVEEYKSIEWIKEPTKLKKDLEEYKLKL